MSHTGRIFRTLALFAVLILLLSLPFLTLAQEDDIVETFDAAELPEWELAPDVAVAGGVLRLRPGSFALRMGDLSDPTFALRVKLTGPGGIAVNYAFRDDTHYHLQLLEEIVILERIEAGAPTRLGEVAFPNQAAGDWFELRIALTGELHQISFNGEPLIEATDPAPLDHGAVLFHPEGEATVEIDTLTIQTSPPEPGREPEPEPPDAGGPETPAATPQPGDGGQWGLVEEFFASQAGAPELAAFVINLGLAALSAFILGRVYIHWGASLSNRRRFASNFMLLTLTTTFIILVVRSSIALSLGLVGALSIVRFRTAVKEPEELAYLFFAIGLGIGLGDSQRLVTLLALAVTIAILGLIRLTRRPHDDINLHLTLASHNPHKVDMNVILAALTPHCAKWKLLRFDENAETLELALMVEFRALEAFERARAALRALSEGLEITFLDNRGLW